MGMHAPLHRELCIFIENVTQSWNCLSFKKSEKHFQDGFCLFVRIFLYFSDRFDLDIDSTLLNYTFWMDIIIYNLFSAHFVTIFLFCILLLTSIFFKNSSPLCVLCHLQWQFLLLSINLTYYPFTCSNSIYDFGFFCFLFI